MARSRSSTTKRPGRPRHRPAAKGRKGAAGGKKTKPAARDVFISRAGDEKKLPGKICEVLESSGISCWIAPRNIIGGQEWAEAIVEAMEVSRIMVLVFGASANDSPYVKREVELAVKNNVIIVPFRVEDVEFSKYFKFYLGTPHRLDAFTPPMEGHIERLKETVRTLLSNLRKFPGPKSNLRAARISLRPGAEATQEQPLAPELRAAPEPKGARILVVDDEPDMRDHLEMTLRMEGFAVQTAEDGEQGLLKAKTDPPDLILLDVLMPKLSGFDVLRGLKADQKTAEIPVIVMTKEEAHAFQIQAFDLDADSFIWKKDIKPDSLKARVQALLRKRAASGAAKSSQAADGPSGQGKTRKEPRA